MKEQGRLPVTDPPRVQERLKKLWAREMSMVIGRQQMQLDPVDHPPAIQIICSCALCNNGMRMAKYVTTVATHLQDNMYGQHPTAFGSTHVFSRLCIKFAYFQSMYSLPSAASCAPTFILSVHLLMCLHVN